MKMRTRYIRISCGFDQQGLPLILKMLTFGLIIMLSVGLFSGCQNSKSYNLGLVISNESNPFFISLVEGAEKASKQGLANLKVLGSEDDANLEYEHVKILIDSGVDCIIINPTDSDAAYKGIEYANDHKVPVITVDRASLGGQVVCHIESNNEAGGAAIAQYLLEMTQHGGSYAELRGIEGTSATQTRGKGFNDIMAKETGMSLVAVVNGDFDRRKGKEAMEKLLAVHPTLSALFAHNDEMALGAIEAAKEANSQVLIFGFDGTDQGRQAVEAGEMAATIAQQPELLGSTAIEQALAYLQGKAIESSVLVDVELIKNQ